jgi:very-short-patch-repair endonuclease
MSSTAAPRGSNATGTPTAAVSTARREAVDRARQSWIRKLIDLSRRNNLLYYRPLKTGTLDLSFADSSGMATLLRGIEPVPLGKLLPNGKDESVTNLARDIARRAQANAEEKGLQTLFVSLGMATWDASDGGRPADAALLLFPVALETKGSHSFSISRAGAVQVNLVLLHVLDTQFGVKVNSEDLIAHLRGDDEDEPFDTAPLYDELRRLANDVPGFEVKSSAVLGNFAFQKMAMVKDLQERASELAAHDIVAAIAGDNEARTALSEPRQDLDPKELDRMSPDNEFIVLDADSSQQCAIANVLAGQNAVIHGPPGTGKSQTIANLVATLAATGHRVLFVAEKRAALEVVLRRLKDIGLGHLAIDLHGADLSPRKVMQQVAEALDKVRNAVPADCDKVHKQLVDRRTRLNEHVERLHSKRQPTELSIYQMQGKLLCLGNQPRTNARWRGEELYRLKPDIAEHICDLLAEAAGFESLFLRSDPSPWTGARLPDGPAVRHALDLVSHANTQTFPLFMASLHAVVQHSGLRWPTSVESARENVDLVAAVQGKLEVYSRDIYGQNHDSLLHDLEPGQSGGLSGVWAWLTSSAYRRARKVVRGLRTGGPTPAATLFSDLKEVQQQTVSWKRQAENDSLPCYVPDFASHKQNTDSLFSDTSAIASMLPGKHINQFTIDQLGDLIRHLAADDSTPQQIPKLTKIEEQLDAAGVANLVNEIRGKKSENRTWSQVFLYSWLSSTIDAASLDDPDIRGFRGTTHNRFVDEFVHLDEERIAIASERVRRAHGLRAVEAMNAHPDQQHLIKAEAAKVKRHLPLRKIFAQSADVLTAVCPCWMASPLSVSQLLDGGRQYFDFVIFDEASQVLPEDAVPALLRGKKVVVAGDNKQLPPTTFFAASDEEEYAADEEAGAAEGFESLLDMMIPFVRSCYLDWHYRSRDEALINFSNHYIYKGRLVTFPGPGGTSVISHETVQQEAEIDGQEESAATEVRKVVDLVIHHAREHPDQTLGVITMGIKHMNRIQAALDREVEKHSEVETFFDPNASERFFVKNLERVQGDERDAIIISIGYAKDRAGNLPLRFGPLLSEGGRRRLNVAVTRARQKLTVVSSFSYADIDLSRVRAGSGVELLRDYLQYAASNGKRLGDGQLTTIPLNDFETEVFDVLTTQGLKLIPQVGASQFRIDMVAQHPSKPGRFVLAIECDGATYHSSYTARDRDRLRQQQLENLGWRFHRIWSTDWFMRKQEEVERAMQAFQAALNFADKLDAGFMRSGDDGNGRPEKAKTNGVSPSAKERARRPAIPMRTSIAQYSPYELVQLILWLASDGQLRTDDEIMTEMISVLGFSRRGARIETAIKSALQTYRAVQSRP